MPPHAIDICGVGISLPDSQAERGLLLGIHIC